MPDPALRRLSERAVSSPVELSRFCTEAVDFDPERISSPLPFLVCGKSNASLFQL